MPLIDSQVSSSEAILAALLCCVLGCFAITSGQSPPAASLAPPTDATLRPEKGADVLARARDLYNREGPKLALPEYEKALALLQAEGDKKNEAITLGLIGNCYKRFGDFPKAEDFLQRALTLKRTTGDRLEEGRTLSHLGLLH